MLGVIARLTNGFRLVAEDLGLVAVAPPPLSPPPGASVYRGDRAPEPLLLRAARVEGTRTAYIRRDVTQHVVVAYAQEAGFSLRPFWRARQARIDDFAGTLRDVRGLSPQHAVRANPTHTALSGGIGMASGHLALSGSIDNPRLSIVTTRDATHYFMAGDHERAKRCWLAIAQNPSLRDGDVFSCVEGILAFMSEGDIEDGLDIFRELVKSIRTPPPQPTVNEAKAGHIRILSFAEIAKNEKSLWRYLIGTLDALIQNPATAFAAYLLLRDLAQAPDRDKFNEYLETKVFFNTQVSFFEQARQNPAYYALAAMLAWEYWEHTPPGNPAKARSERFATNSAAWFEEGMHAAFERYSHSTNDPTLQDQAASMAVVLAQILMLFPDIEARITLDDIHILRPPRVTKPGTLRNPVQRDAIAAVIDLQEIVNQIRQQLAITIDPFRR